NQKDISENVIPFFTRFNFLSAKKKRDFSKFSSIVELIENGEHLQRVGIQRILEIRRDMNDGGAERRKYSDRHILDLIDKQENPQRLHAESE
ncbi:MAG: hypothetical protein MI702_10345, partial [Chlorobiales bacterium]|nr:hypothetical protein [Chlorobiales bacterium]